MKWLSRALLKIRSMIKKRVVGQLGAFWVTIKGLFYSKLCILVHLFSFMNSWKYLMDKVHSSDFWMKYKYYENTDLHYHGATWTCLFFLIWLDIDLHFILINTSNKWYENDPFILAIQAKQVFCCPDMEPKRGGELDLYKIFEISAIK